MKHILKRIAALLLMICVFSILPSVATADLPPKEELWPEDGVFYDDEYAYIVTDGQATILDFYGGRNVGDNGELTLPGQLGGYPVAAIGRQAFQAYYPNDRLTSVDIPNGVISIGDYAFYYSKNLASISIPDSVITIGNGAFLYCSNLTRITIPDGVTTIGYDAFWNCSSLENVSIPPSVLFIGHDAFSDCKYLSLTVIQGSYAEKYAKENEIHYVLLDASGQWEYVLEDGSATIIGWVEEPSGDLRIPSELDGFPVTCIGDYAFYDCGSLEMVILPDGLLEICESAFEACASLTSIEIPASIKRIGEYAFYDCGSLEMVILPDGLLEICESAFEACASLTSIEIPESVEEIGDHAFSDSGLQSVELPSGLTSIPWGAFSGSCLTGIQFPETVYSIDDYAFSGCNGLTDVKIPASAWRIGEGAFASCANLTSIFIPATMRIIHETAFSNCDNLTVYTDSEGYVTDFMAMYGIPCEIQTDKVENADNTNGDFDYSIENGGAVITGYTGSSDELVIPDELDGYPVTGIGANAFEEVCLTSVTIPATVKAIANNSFYVTLEHIHVSPENPVYESIDGVLFDVEQGTLLVYPPAKEETAYHIPQGIIAIGERAFMHAGALTSVTLPDSLLTIGEMAFIGCRNLRTLEIPDGVTLIGEYAFIICDVLELLVSKNSYAEQYAIENEIPYILTTE